MNKDKLLAITYETDIPSIWRDTAIEKFIRAQNMDYQIFAEPRAQRFNIQSLRIRRRL